VRFGILRDGTPPLPNPFPLCAIALIILYLARCTTANLVVMLPNILLAALSQVSVIAFSMHAVGFSRNEPQTAARPRICMRFGNNALTPLPAVRPCCSSSPAGCPFVTIKLSRIDPLHCTCRYEDCCVANKHELYRCPLLHIFQAMRPSRVLVCCFVAAMCSSLPKLCMIGCLRNICICPPLDRQASILVASWRHMCNQYSI